MKHLNIPIITAILTACVITMHADAPKRQIVTFTELNYASGNYWNGSDESGGFSSRNALFNNEYNAAWGSWSGFSYSRVNDTNTVGTGNQYAVWEPGTGIGSTGSYAVVYASIWPTTNSQPTAMIMSSATGPGLT